jgi:hypothetical protein
MAVLTRGLFFKDYGDNEQMAPKSFLVLGRFIKHSHCINASQFISSV